MKLFLNPVDPVHSGVQPPSPGRRAFCAYACQAMSAVAIGSLSACGGSPTGPSNVPQLGTVAATVNGRTISVNVAASPSLATVGSAAALSTPLGPFLIVRTAADAFNALSGTCTHEACTVSGFSDNHFVCPCHGSQYNLEGGVLMGPAPRSLTRFNTQLADGILTFTV